MKNSHNNFSFYKNLSGSPSLRTDLACESINCNRNAKGTSYREYELCSVEISEFLVKSADGEKLTGKKRGRYVTLHTPLMRYLDEDRRWDICEALSRILASFTKDITNKCISPSTKVLIAGLGNRFISADSIGPRTVDKIAVTSHMMDMSQGDLFRMLGCSSLCAIHPGVMGQTGIEAAAMIKGACDYARPDLVIAVDALAARSTKRLCATIQLCDTGIEPGSGIGNRRGSIDRDSLGCPVIALGVPTVVDSATLICDALISAGITKADRELESVLSRESSFFVSPRDCDVVCEEISTILASAINRTFRTEGL